MQKKEHAVTNIIVICLAVLAVSPLALVLLAVYSGHMPVSTWEYSYRIASGYHVTRSESKGPSVVIELTGPDNTVAVQSLLTGIVCDVQFILASRTVDRSSSPAPLRPLVQSDSSEYYIFDLRQNNKYGPLTETEFASERLLLGVSSDLQLADPDYYKYSGH